MACPTRKWAPPSPDFTTSRLTTLDETPPSDSRLHRLTRPLVVRFLRETARGPLVEALPGEPGRRSFPSRVAAGLLRSTGRCVGRFLSAERKVAIQEALINRYRIPVNWQPRAALEETFERCLARLVAAEGESPGDYLEFGVYQGNSMVCMHRALEKLGLDTVRLFGFDSFAGLPESADLDGIWSPGQFRSDVEFTRHLMTEAGVDWSRTHLIEGFFDQVLRPSTASELGIERAAVIMIASDLYTSTLEDLDFCTPVIEKRFIVLFDDWESTDAHHGEKRAFTEFLARHPDLEARDLDPYHGRARVVELSST